MGTTRRTWLMASRGTLLDPHTAGHRHGAPLTGFRGPLSRRTGLLRSAVLACQAGSADRRLRAARGTAGSVVRQNGGREPRRKLL